jgi:uncharacterized membrane protein YkoI
MGTHGETKGGWVNRKKLVIGAAAAATLALGGGGAAIAAQQAAEEEGPLKDGSITAPVGSGGENEAAGSEVAEEKAEARHVRDLQQLTRIDRAAAEETAPGTVPGEATEVKLENEGGFVVFEVEVAGDDGGLHEVVVDAGNGEILGQEIEEGED